MNDQPPVNELWAEAAQEIDWFSAYSDILDTSRAPLYRWFPGATCNTSYNCLDRHVAGGRAEQTAIIYDSPVTDTVQHISYRELLEGPAGRPGSRCAASRELPRTARSCIPHGRRPAPIGHREG